MTDNLPATVPQSPIMQWEERERLEKKAIALNKTNIIEALKLAGIASVTVEFNGSDDNGGIDCIICQGTTDSIPDVPVNEWAPGEKNTLVGKEARLPTAIENFAYNLLSHTHVGWENDGGAYGDITIDVSTETITHTHNTRIQDYVTDTYSY